MRRVVITGTGAVTPLGTSIADTLAALASGASATAPAGGVEGSARVAAVAGFDPRPRFRAPKSIKLCGRPAQFAVAAAAMALDTARWPDDDRAAESLGVVLGSSASDSRAAEIAAAIGPDPERRCTHDVPWFTERMLGGLNPLWLLLALPSMSSAHVAIQFNARGPNNTLMSDWAAGHQAIGEAFDWIRLGEADAVLAGGTDSAVAPLVRAAYDQAGVWDQRPESNHGHVPAEGAAVLLIEALEQATIRNAPVLAEIHAYANHGPCRPANGGSSGALTAAMTQALAHAGWAPGDVEVVGTAGMAGGPDSEDAALASALGSHARLVRRVEFTSRLGHTLAAAGPIDLAIALSSARPGGAPVRTLWNAAGYSGQVVTLAITIGGSESAQGGRA